MNTMKISITVAVVAGVAALLVFWSQQQLLNNEEAQDHSSTDDSSMTEPLSTPGDWQSYTNDEYAFALKHPSNWEIQEALKPQEPRALHEIYVQESEPSQWWRGDLTIQIFANDDALTVEQWWEEWLVAEDAEEAACREEYGEMAPCLYLRGMLQDEVHTTFAGQDAIAIELFQFDHTKGCTYVAHENVIIGLCSVVGENPNDPDAEEHLRITETLRSSFELQ